MLMLRGPIPPGICVPFDSRQGIIETEGKNSPRSLRIAAMSANALALLRHIRRLATQTSQAPDRDAVLLGRFLQHRDEDAFTALVRRHGPLVLRVCRRVLADADSADDAFQATFCVLARKAVSVRPPEALAGWLHSVAYRVALKARAGAARRRARETAVPSLEPADRRPDPLTELSARELLAAVDEEVGRLPEAYRLPVVLCCLEGRTREEAARLLGWTEGAVKGRLERGRARLHARLAQRGLTLAGALAAVEVMRGAATLALAVEATARAALDFAAGPGQVGAAVSSRVATLTGAGLEGLAPSKVKIALLLLAALALGGTGVLAHQAVAQRHAHAPQKVLAPPTVKGASGARPDGPATVRTDHYGDALPQGAVARLGAMRWRHPVCDTRGLAFSPDGKVLAARCRGEILAWDTATGRELCRLPLTATGPHLSYDRNVNWGAGPDFSPDGKTLAVQATTGEVTFWEVATGKRVRTLTLPPESMGNPDRRDLRLSPDGKVLAVTDGAGNVYLLDMMTGRVIHRLGGERPAELGLRFSPDGKTLAVGRYYPSPQVVQLWEVATGKLLHTIEDREDMFAFPVAFSPDSRTFASGGPDRIVCWDVATGKAVRRLEAKVQYWFTGLAFTPDGKALMWSDREGKVRVRDIEKNADRVVIEGPRWDVCSVVLSPDGKIVARGTTSPTIGLWDVATGKELFTEFQGHGTTAHCVAFTPDGKSLVSGGEPDDQALFSSRDSAQVYVWDTATWKQTRRLKVAATELSFAPDGRRMATTAYSKKVSARDFATGTEAYQLQLPDTVEIRKPVFSRDGRVLVSLDWTPAPGTKDLRGGGRLVVWDAASGKQIRRIPVPELNPQPSEVWFNPSSLAVTPDGRKALVGDNEGVIHLYDLDTGKQIQPLFGHKQYVDALDLSADGKTLVSGSLDRGVRLWDLVSGQEIATLAGHRRGVTAVAFSPDGRLAASAGGSFFEPREVEEPRQIRVWDVATGKQVAHFEGHGADVTSLAFAPDGSTLVSGTWDGTVLVWDVRSLPRLPRPGVPAGSLDALWRDLASADARKAHQAIWALIGAPDRTVPFIAEHLTPAPTIRRERTARLLADLDNDQFTVREAAFRELTHLGPLVQSDVEQALRHRPSPEARKRLEALLSDMTGLAHSPEDRQVARAVQVLERIGKPAARRLLVSLSGGAAEARLTREAKASLERLPRWPAPAP